jgi:hypothetical protein
MPRLPCPLCKTFERDPAPSVEIGYSVEKSFVKCSRCGDYYIHSDLTTPDRQPSEDYLIRLSHFARAETEAGRNAVFSRANLEDTVRRAPRPSTFAGYYDRVLRRIAGECRFPGNDMTPIALLVLAADAFLPARNYEGVVRQLHAAGLVEVTSFDPLGFSARPTLNGWLRVDQLRASSRRAAVAMWFDPALAPALAAIEGAVAACGFEPPFRVEDAGASRPNDPEAPNKVEDRTLAMLRKARFLVADATAHRQSVYYQAGYAEALGIPVIWTSRPEAEAYLALDGKRVDVTWASPEELRHRLEAQLRARGLVRG